MNPSIESYVAGFHRGDWYAEALQQAVPQVALAERDHAKRLADRNTLELMRLLRQEAFSFAINVGIPPATRLGWVRGEVEFWGAAGYADAPDTLERPHILLHESLVERYKMLRDTAWLVHRTFLGVCVHEAGHLAYTQTAYRLPTESTSSHRERLFANLLEDNRIERLVANDLPGYIPYLFAARRELHATGFADMLMQWGDMRESEQAALLACLYIRAPEAIPLEVLDEAERPDHQWMERLRNIMPTAPQTETEVWHTATAIVHFLEELDEAQQSEDASGDGYEFEPDPSITPSEYEGRTSRSSPYGEFADTRIADLCEIADRLGNMSTDNLERVELLEVAGGFEEAAASHTGIGRSTDHKESAVDRRISWSEADQSSSQRHVKRDWFPGFHHATQQIRAAWGEPPRRNRVRRKLESGKLDRRRLPWATTDSRLFCRSVGSPLRKPTDLVLLLDASGSMHGQRHRYATQSGLLLTEAFHDHPNVSLSVFCHDTDERSRLIRLMRHEYGLRNSDESSEVRIRHLFGDHLRQRNWASDYVADGGNEDYEAIEAVAKRIGQSKALHRPILIVISDGEPCGSGRRGMDAVGTTKAVADDLRSRGWRVFGLGLGDVHACEQIYGKRFVEQVDCESKLPKHLRNLIIRCSRQE